MVGLILLASLAFFHAAARTVKTYQFWADKADKFEKKLASVNADIVRLRKADRDHPLDDSTIGSTKLGVEQLRIDLGRVLANRGRVWTKCDKEKASSDPQKPGILDVTVSTEDSATFAKNMVLYAFEEGDEQSPGKYLGEFRVDAVSDKRVVLASTSQMVKSDDPKVFKSLADNVYENKTPWVLYEMMPTDEHEAFTNLTEDQKKWIPKEYAEDGKLGADGKTIEFSRPLRDYLTIFRDYEMYRTVFADRMASAVRDQAYLAEADKQVKEEQAAMGKERAKVQGEKQRADAERAAVASHYNALQRMLESNQLAVKAAIARNVQSAQEIARLQKEAADLIDRRTRSMAQYGPGAN